MATPVPLATLLGLVPGGLYTDQDGFAILHPVRLLVVEGMAALLVLALLGWGMVRLLRRRRGRRAERLALGA